ILGRYGKGGRGSDVTFEDAGLGESGEALADGPGALLTDAVDAHELVDPGGEQLLQAAEVAHQPVHDRGGQPGDLRQPPVPAGAHGAVERVVPGGQPEDPGDVGQVEQLVRVQRGQVGLDLRQPAGRARALDVVPGDELAVGTDASDE